MQNLLVGLALIVTLGVTAQWLAWRTRLPAILLLLLFGFGAGAGARWIQPDLLFGELLIPLISFSVALILFEGGLSLKISELKQIGNVLKALLTLGVLVTWVVGTLALYFLLELPFSIALLAGAILVVTGPTVIGPLLRQMRLKGQTGSILKWEGIVIDPIGAMLAVLVFEAILAGGFQIATLQALQGIAKTVFAGGLLGWLGAWTLIKMMKKFWIPDFLQNPVSFMLVLVVFVLSNQIQQDSGLLAATLMGIVLANQKQISIKHIIEFKENLRVLLISTLFIILAARLTPADLKQIGAAGWIFLAILIFAARPLAVFLSTAKSRLQFREKLFLSFMAPRGIVAAAVASVFAHRLSLHYFEGVEKMVPITFFVITGTVFLYGIVSPLLARLLKLSDPDPKGVLIAGAHFWAREVAQALKENRLKARLVDTNAENIRIARWKGLDAENANILSEETTDRLDLEGIGKLMALTSNDEVNAMAAIHFMDTFGRAEVYQLPFKKREGESEEKQTLPSHLVGRILFSGDADFNVLSERFHQGSRIETVTVTKEFDFEAYKVRPKSALPLFCIDPDGTLAIYTKGKHPKPLPGQKLVSLVNP